MSVSQMSEKKMGYGRYLFLGSGLLLCLLGCGDSGPATGIVTGIVTLEGKPVEGAFVTFEPMFEEGTICESAEKTDAQGYYEMQYSAEKNGVLLGEHRVHISTADFEKQPDGSNKRIPERVPKFYFGPDTVLRFTVEEGENDGSFELTKKRPN